jgi:cellulose synthase (UDP-forming)
VANVFWAFVNAFLAFVVIVFSRRLSSFRRREYRFPVPLPVLLDLSGRSPQAGVLDDVSGHGFRYYGLFPAQIGVGDVVSGEVILPEARVRCQARVRARLGAGEDNEARSLGCEFEWERPGDGDELLAFLYGSDLQWKLNRIAEKTRTPLERFVRWVRRAPADPRDTRAQWAPVLIRASAGEAPGPGVISVQTALSTSRTLVSFRKLSVDKDLTVFVTTRAGTQTLRGDAEPLDTMVSSGTPLYVYRFEGRANPQVVATAMAA